MPALLEVRDLAVRYHAGSGPPGHALDEISFDVAAGDSVGLLGESGSGKTTLLLAILGLLPPAAHVERGTVLLAGEDVLAMPEPRRRTLRGARMAIVFQDPSLALNPVRRVGTQVAEVRRAHGGGPRRRCREEALAALAEVGFADADRVYQSYPHELSGGQRQRVVIAQALVCRPALLLADEPFSALDSTTQAELRALLSGLQLRLGLALIVASHDLASLGALARRALVLYAGRTVERGTTAEVLGRPLHPYTRGLLGAFPPPLGSGGRALLRPIPGAPPDPARLPAGCAFEARCPDRVAACAERPPGEVSPGEGRRVRCFSYGG